MFQIARAETKKYGIAVKNINEALEIGLFVKMVIPNDHHNIIIYETNSIVIYEAALNMFEEQTKRFQESVEKQRKLKMERTFEENEFDGF